ncbi:MAG: hypothetical protein AB9869_04750 [Verrucomicrobiia bacterium]
METPHTHVYSIQVDPKKPKQGGKMLAAALGEVEQRSGDPTAALELLRQMVAAPKGSVRALIHTAAFLIRSRTPSVIGFIDFTNTTGGLGACDCRLCFVLRCGLLVASGKTASEALAIVKGENEP